MLRQFPETFSVPTRYIKHTMVVADLASGDAGRPVRRRTVITRLRRLLPLGLSAA
jgi:hypothetical protein